jgi:hypothetical protein
MQFRLPRSPRGKPTPSLFFAKLFSLWGVGLGEQREKSGGPASTQLAPGWLGRVKRWRAAGMPRAEGADPVPRTLSDTEPTCA